MVPAFRQLETLLSACVMRQIKCQRKLLGLFPSSSRSQGHFTSNINTHTHTHFCIHFLLGIFMFHRTFGIIISWDAGYHRGMCVSHQCLTHAGPSETIQFYVRECVQEKDIVCG